MFQQLAAAEPNTRVVDPLGRVVYQERVGIGEGIFLVSAGLLAVGVGLAPIWPALIWSWFMCAAVVLLGVMMIGASVGRFRKAGTVCTFNEHGARRLGRNGGVDQELRYEDVEELEFTLTRLYMNGTYSGTFQHLVLGSGRTGEEKYRMTRSFREDTGLVTAYRVPHELEPVSNRIAGLMAERMQKRLERGQTVGWTEGLTIDASGINLPGRGGLYATWEQIDRIQIDQGMFRLWLTEERKPRVQVPTCKMNFFPGYFLVTLMLEKSSPRPCAAPHYN